MYSPSLVHIYQSNPICRYQYILQLTVTSIHYIASQAWCLGRFLPLLIGDLVPYDDKHWDNYLDLLKIMEYVFAPVTTMGKMSYLEMLIEEYLAEFVQLYPSRPLTPKIHYLVHVPTWTKR